MRSILKSIQPRKQPGLAKPLPASNQCKQPTLPSAPLGNAQPSTSKGAVNALNAQPGTSKSASYAETAPTFQNPSLDRKRDAEGRLRKENNYQAGLSPAKCMAFDAAICLSLCIHLFSATSHVHQSQAKESWCVCWAGTAYSNASGPAARRRVEAQSAGADDDDAIEEDDVQQVKQLPAAACIDAACTVL